MSVVAVVGDACTTTALALAAAWPAEEDAVVAELDPSGGDVAAWLDVPTDPGLASAVAAAPSGSWPVMTDHLQRTPGGLAVLVGPLWATEAAVVVREATMRLVPTLSALDRPVVLADCGAQHPSALSGALTQAALAVVGVRQPHTSARAAAAHIGRAGELVDALLARSIPTVLAVIGTEPYGAAEVASFLGGPGGALPTVALAEDPSGAALLAGRPGSRRRGARSRLLASAGPAAAELSLRLRATRSHAGEVLAEELGP